MASSYPEQPQFTTVARHYDALMRGVPYRGWVRYLEKLFAHFAIAPNRILDLACGTGTVSEILVAKDYTVVGADIAEPMIAEARRKAARRQLPITYYVQDAASLALPEPPFDLCISLFDSLNYITEPAALASAVRHTAQHLTANGWFIFDINSAFALENGFFDQDNLESNDRLRYVWRSEYDSATRLCSVFMRFFYQEANGVDSEFRETHVQYAYTEMEIREMLAAAGFCRIETFRAYTFQPTSPTTDRIFFVAQR